MMLSANVGDLVNFKSQSWVFAHSSDKDKNPGIIIEAFGMGLGECPTFKVLWANQEITIEHWSYINTNLAGE